MPVRVPVPVPEAVGALLAEGLGVPVAEGVGVPERVAAWDAVPEGVSVCDGAGQAGHAGRLSLLLIPPLLLLACDGVIWGVGVGAPERVCEMLPVCDCDGVGEQSTLRAVSSAPRYGRACAQVPPPSADAQEP